LLFRQARAGRLPGIEHVGIGALLAGDPLDKMQWVARAQRSYSDVVQAASTVARCGCRSRPMIFPGHWRSKWSDNFVALSWPGIAVRRTASLGSPMSRPSRLGEQCVPERGHRDKPGDDN